MLLQMLYRSTGRDEIVQGTSNSSKRSDAVVDGIAALQYYGISAIIAAWHSMDT